MCPFSSLAFLQPTIVDKEPTKSPILRLYTICSGYIPYGYYGAYFVVEKKFHKIYNEKQPNHH